MAEREDGRGGLARFSPSLNGPFKCGNTKEGGTDGAREGRKRDGRADGWMGRRRGRERDGMGLTRPDCFSLQRRENRRRRTSLAMHCPLPRGGCVRNVILPVAVPMPANLPPLAAAARALPLLALSVFVIGLGSLKTRRLFIRPDIRKIQEGGGKWMDRPRDRPASPASHASLAR